MKKTITCTLLAISLTGLFGFIKYDDDIIKKVTAQLNKWAAANPQEKVYLHLDKPYYAAGDDIWFKAYVTKGGEHRLSDLSGVLNVELICDKDSITKAIKLPLIAGMAWGDFKLADSLAEGKYRIRAYTNYMLNAGEDYFFDKTIEVGNSISNNVIAKASYTFGNAANGQQKVDAIISYTDLEGKSYSEKEVSYTFEMNSRQAARGKGITDNKGNLNLSFVNATPSTFKSGNIITSIKLSPNERATKIVPFNVAQPKVDVQFFPEGGSLVNGIRTRVAFKAVSANGLGVDVKGMLIDEQNNEVAEIITDHLGMGSFAFTPTNGKSYSAKLTYPDGTTNTIPLSKATDEGYVLNVYSNNPNELTVKVSVNENTLKKEQNGEVNLVAQSGGNIVFAAKTKLGAASFSTKIPKSRFPSGIAQFTLFSGTGEPLNERIAFIQNNDQLKLSLQTDKTSYSSREKVNISVSAKNKDNQPVTGCFSVAVINENEVQSEENDESTIFSNILLTSDIKGYIEKPGYYFTNTNEKTKADLDLLMLTQGYRRFSWKKVMENDFLPLIFQPEEALSISGYVKTSGGKPIAKGKVTLFTTQGGAILLNTVADANGRFVFDNLTFHDSVKFVVQARTDKDGKNVEITLDNIPARFVKKNVNTTGISINLDSIPSAYLQNSHKKYKEDVKYDPGSHTILLKQVEIKEKKPLVEYSENINGPGKADQVILADQAWMTGCLDLATCLSGRLSGVVFHSGVPYLNSGIININSGGSNYSMMLILDGVKFPGDPTAQGEIHDILASLVPTDIQSIEVLKNIAYTALYGAEGADGILVITTKRGGPAPYERYAPGLISYHPIGYYQQREFYSPQYDDPKTNKLAADLRSTIYWNPNVITDENGNASFRFFNADGKGTYKVIVEGIDNDGNLGRQVFRYSVN